MLKKDTTRLITSSETIRLDIQRLATNLDVKLVALEAAVKKQQRLDRLDSVNHLKATVMSAATVISSRTTTLSASGDDLSDMPDYTSDFGDWFRSEASNATLRWIYSDVKDQSLFDYSAGLTSCALEPTKPIKLASNDALTSRHYSTLELPTHGNGDRIDRSRGTEIMSPLPVQKQTELDQNTSSDSLSHPKSTNEIEKRRRRRYASLSASNILRAVRRENSPDVSIKMYESKSPAVPKRRVKIVPVGDGACGKTCFLMCAYLVFTLSW